MIFMKTIIKKEKEIITQAKREKNTNNVKCYPKLIDYNKIKNYELKSIKFLNNQVKIVLSEIENCNKDFLEQIFIMLQQSNTILDLEKVSKFFLSEYEKNLYSKSNTNIKKLSIAKEIIAHANSDIKQNFDIFIVMLIKNIVNTYYTKKLRQLDILEIMYLEDLKIKNASVDRIHNIIGDHLDKVICDKSGIKKMSSRIMLNKIDKIHDDFIGQYHLCWMNCKNATPNKCSKILDLPKLTIDKYDFITDGYQILDNNDIVDTFVVTKCKNYKREYKKTL